MTSWLLEGDVAVQFQTHRDLLGHRDGYLQGRIAREGYGAALLSRCGRDGHWGGGFYQPKWTSTHYTLLELKNLGLNRDHPQPQRAVRLVLEGKKGRDGGLNPTKTVEHSDACVNGMALNYSTYFGAQEEHLQSVVDYLLRQRVPDGGFNCRFHRAEVTHSSVHTTVCVIEGITEYQRSGYRYRLPELRAARAEAAEFLLRHHLYRSERTGRPMDPEMTRLHHPARWRFDILRGLDALVDAAIAYDPRMDDAVQVLRARRRPDGRWPVNKAYPGLTHMPPPQPGQPCRWITLMALRVLDASPEGTAVGRGDQRETPQDPKTRASRTRPLNGGFAV